MTDNNEVKVTETPVTEKPVTEKPVTETPITEKPVTSFLSKYKQFIYGFITGGLVVLVGSELHNRMKPVNQGCYF